MSLADSHDYYLNQTWYYAKNGWPWSTNAPVTAPPTDQYLALHPRAPLTDEVKASLLALYLGGSLNTQLTESLAYVVAGQLASAQRMKGTPSGGRTWVQERDALVLAMREGWADTTTNVFANPLAAFLPEDLLTASAAGDAQLWTYAPSAMDTFAQQLRADVRARLCGGGGSSVTSFFCRGVCMGGRDILDACAYASADIRDPSQINAPQLTDACRAALESRGGGPCGVHCDGCDDDTATFCQATTADQAADIDVLDPYIVGGCSCIKSPYMGWLSAFLAQSKTFDLATQQAIRPPASSPLSNLPCFDGGMCMVFGVRTPTTDTQLASCPIVCENVFQVIRQEGGGSSSTDAIPTDHAVVQTCAVSGYPNRDVVTINKTIIDGVLTLGIGVTPAHTDQTVFYSLGIPADLPPPSTGTALADRAQALKETLKAHRTWLIYAGGAILVLGLLGFLLFLRHRRQ